MARPRSPDYAAKREVIWRRAAESVRPVRLFGDLHRHDRPKACGVSKALLYHYYPDKEAVLFDLLRVASGGADRRRRRPPRIGRGEAKLHALSGALLEAYRDADAAASGADLQPQACSRPTRQEALRKLERRLVDVFAQALGEALPDLAKEPAAEARHAVAVRHAELALPLASRGPAASPAPTTRRLATTLLLGGARGGAGVERRPRWLRYWRSWRGEPSRTWSLIVTLFGDALVPRGGAVWLGDVCWRSSARSDIGDGVVRTAMSRLDRRRLAGAQPRRSQQLSIASATRAATPFARRRTRIYAARARRFGRAISIWRSLSAAADREAARGAFDAAGFGVPRARRIWVAPGGDGAGRRRGRCCACGLRETPRRTCALWPPVAGRWRRRARLTSASSPPSAR